MSEKSTYIVPTDLVPLDQLDRRIIALLYEDGRRSNTEMARQLSVTEATVRKRLDHLLQEKVIRIAAWADPLKIGYKAYVNIEIQAEPRHLDAAAAQISKFPEIFFLGICAGNFDILAVGLFESNEHIYEFLSRRLSQVVGVQRTITSNIIHIIKREFPNPLVEVDKAVENAPAKRPAPNGRNAITPKAAGKARPRAKAKSAP